MSNSFSNSEILLMDNFRSGEYGTVMAICLNCIYHAILLMRDSVIPKDDLKESITAIVSDLQQNALQDIRNYRAWCNHKPANHPNTYIAEILTTLKLLQGLEAYETLVPDTKLVDFRIAIRNFSQAYDDVLLIRAHNLNACEHRNRI